MATSYNQLLTVQALRIFLHLTIKPHQLIGEAFTKTEKEFERNDTIYLKSLKFFLSTELYIFLKNQQESASVVSFLGRVLHGTLELDDAASQPLAGVAGFVAVRSTALVR